jgi:hypothetical protein
MGASAVEVIGLSQTRGLLARFEPDLMKRLDATLSVVARDLKAGAEAKFARTGSGNAYRIRTRNRAMGFSKGVTTQRGSVGRGEKWSSEPGVLAAIFELANKVRDAKPENVERTKSLLATLNAKYGSPGRFLWDAWDERSVAALATVDGEIKAVEAEYTARLRA